MDKYCRLVQIPLGQAFDVFGDHVDFQMDGSPMDFPDSVVTS